MTYRDSADREEPATDAEVAFWDNVFLAIARRENGVTTIDAIAKCADFAVKERRARFACR